MRSLLLVCVLLTLLTNVITDTSLIRNNEEVQETNPRHHPPPVSNQYIRRRTEEEFIEPKSNLFTIGSILGSVICVIVVAMASGLTVGLLPLDPVMLHVKMRAGATEEEKKQAAALLSVLKRRHLLLVSLLLLATLSSEALPIFLHHVMPGFAAVFVAVVLVLFFGKIAPSALCTGPKQIEIVSKFVPLVRFIMWLVYPLAYPIARLLDILVDEEDCEDHEDDLAVALGRSKYDRTELAALIRIQYEGNESAKQRRKSKQGKNVEPTAQPDEGDLELVNRRPGLDKQLDSSIRSLKSEMMAGNQSESFRKHRRSVSIHIDEVSMMEGALQMKTKVAFDIYTPLHKAFCVPHNWSLDERNVVRIYSSGYSRIPVFDTPEGKDVDRSAIRGILMTRQLIMVKPSQDTSISSLPLNIPMCISPKINLVDLMNLFQDGGKRGKGGHMALVCARPEIGNKALDEKKVIPDSAGLMGIITLEDVLEALLQEQIYDEMDAAGRIGGPQEIEVAEDDEYHLV